MINYNRKEHMKKIHETRKMNTRKKVDEAIQRLIRANENINFNSVAEEAGVAKATLYNNTEIRERIGLLRQQNSQIPTPKQLKREINDNNKNAIIESLKRKIKKLEDDNKQLREQLKVAYGEVYKKL
ncbi:DUF6262 family protein [Oceanobacillus sp. FSL W7-1309]|uniref:DUF6262 family protein n=1 Tax=Oceanobacillus sp. FSL W7-1309 TaxID=2954539 RepID=UPI0030FA132F